MRLGNKFAGSNPADCNATSNTKLYLVRTDSKATRDQVITFGFVRECQKLLPSNNTYYIIPIEIFEIFYDYYHLQIMFHQHVDYQKMQ